MAADDIFDEDLVLVGLDAPSDEAVIRALGKRLFDAGWVKDSFVPAAVERERTFPTGLPTQPVGTAIPHTDSKHVNRTGIAVGVLARPVGFGNMGEPTATVEASLVFLVAVHEPERQVQTLSSLAQLLHNAALLQELVRSKDAHAVVSILNREVSASPH